MYLKQVYIENSGPLKQVCFDLPFTPTGAPKPLILVGGNGSGKTNFLSIVADALLEAASGFYENIAPPGTRRGRPYFRVVGSTTRTIGAPGAATILRFEDESDTFFFREKSGRLEASELAPRLPESLRNAANWQTEGNIKEFKIIPEKARILFQNSIFAYFPTNRNEPPHWLNTESVAADIFDTEPFINTDLRRPIYLERSVKQLCQWILSLINDSRLDIVVATRISTDNTPPPALIQAANATGLLQTINIVLKIILNDNDIHIAWLGRHSDSKLGIARGGKLFLSSMYNLSSGQITLLGIFGSLLYYGDSISRKGVRPPNQLEGICIIDEVDAHMHVDLQYKALPGLIKMFPKIQFILTSYPQGSGGLTRIA